MANINWNRIHKQYANFEPKIQYAKYMKRKEIELATDKQKKFMDDLGIEYPKNIYKRDAMSLISKSIEKKKSER